MGNLTETPVLSLADRPPWRLVLWLAWPVLLQQFLVLAVSLSDRFLAGRFERGVAAQSAQTTATYLNWMLSSYTSVVCVGATALVARFIGGNDRDGAVRVTHQALLLAVAFGILGGALGLVLVGPVVRALNLQGEAAELAVAYLLPGFLFLPFQMIEAAGIACLAGAGDTRTGLWVQGGIALVNVPLAWLFYHGAGPLPGLGFVGIALGTAMSFMLGSLAVLGVLFHGRAGLRLRPELLRPRLDLERRLLRISIPAGVNSLSAVLGQLWFLSIVNQLGDTASTAHGIALGWEAMAFLPGTAFGTAAMTLVGQYLGAGRTGLAARSGWVAYGLGCAVMATMGAIFFVLAPEMFRLFCPQPEKLAVVDVGVPVLRLVAFAMPALAACIVFSQALAGAGDTRVPVIFTWFGFLGVRVPLAYVLTADWVGLGLFGAWLAMFADLVVRGAFFSFRYAAGRWQRLRV